MDPVWCTVNASFLCISRRQNLNYPFFFRKLYPPSLNSQDFLHTIIIIPRRGSPKTTKKISENYEYTGHSVDTINYNVLLSVAERTYSFYSVHFAYFWQRAHLH